MATDSSTGDVTLPEEVRAVNVGLAAFGSAVREQGATAVDVDWRVPAGGDPDLVAALTRLHGRHGPRVERANAEVLRRLDEGAPVLHGVARAGEVVPGMDERAVLHPGPPLAWDELADPLRRSVRATVVAEGWAGDLAEVDGLISSGQVQLEPANSHDVVVPMAATLGPSGPVWVVENPQGGNRAYAPLNQGPGQTPWMGVANAEAVERLRWLRDVAGPVLDRVVRASDPVDIFSLAAQGLSMGDDLHMRTQAATNHLMRHLLPALVGLDDPRRTEVARFLSGNHLFFLTLGMAGAKAVVEWAADVAESSIVVRMARNGTTFGVALAGARGTWHVADAPAVEDALYHPDYGPDDAALDIGDSAVLELVGLGGAAAAASPAVASFLGGTIADAVEATRRFELACIGRSSRFRLPLLDFRGAPVGLDVRKVVELEATPSINTGILHASEGLGQVGAGIARAPVGCFQKALLALDRSLG